MLDKTGMTSSRTNTMTNSFNPRQSDMNDEGAVLASQRKNGTRSRQERRPITLYLRPGDQVEAKIIAEFNNHAHGQEYLRELISLGFKTKHPEIFKIQSEGEQV